MCGKSGHAGACAHRPITAKLGLLEIANWGCQIYITAMAFTPVLNFKSRLFLSWSVLLNSVMFVLSA